VSKSQGKNGQTVKSEKSETTDGHRVEGGGFMETRGFGQVKWIEEGHAEDRGGLGEAGWYQEPGLR